MCFAFKEKTSILLYCTVDQFQLVLFDWFAWRLVESLGEGPSAYRLSHCYWATSNSVFFYLCSMHILAMNLYQYQIPVHIGKIQVEVICGAFSPPPLYASLSATDVALSKKRTTWTEVSGSDSELTHHWYQSSVFGSLSDQISGRYYCIPVYSNLKIFPKIFPFFFCFCAHFTFKTSIIIL